MHEETNVHVPTPEEVRNNSQIQQADYQQPQQYSWQPSQPQMQQEQSQTEESAQEEENSEVSKFGSAWDQNVNGRQ